MNWSLTLSERLLREFQRMIVGKFAGPVGSAISQSDDGEKVVISIRLSDGRKQFCICGSSSEIANDPEGMAEKAFEYIIKKLEAQAVPSLSRRRA